MKKFKTLTIFLSLLLCAGFVANAQTPFAWEELLVSSGSTPAARTDAKMLLDDANNKLYLTCGSKGLLQDLKDTWAFDLTAKTWSQLSPTGTAPSGGGEGATAVDPVNLKLYYLDRAGTQGNQYDNVKVFDAVNNTWTQLETTGEETPYSISGAMAFDSNENRLIYFGGSYWDQGTIYINDTFALDLETLAWTKLATKGNPTGRTFCHAAYNSVDNTFVLFGGQTAEYISAEFFQLNLETLRWEPIIPANPIAPDGRIKASFSYDPLGNRVFLFGGFNGAKKYDTIDAYDFEDDQWTTLSTTGDKPVPRKGSASDIFIPALTEASTLPYLVIFGGDDETGKPISDTWRIYFDLTTQPPKPPVMTIKTNKTSYSLGDTLTATYDLVNEGPATTVDLAVVLQHPYGYFFLMACTTEISMFKTGVELDAGESQLDQPIFSITLPELPVGTYYLHCAVIKDGALQSGVYSISFTYN